MTAARLLSLRRTLCRYRLLLLFCTALLAGCIFPSIFSVGVLPVSGREIGVALISLRAFLFSASVYAVCFLLSAVSLLGYGCGLFLIGASTAVCAAFFYQVFGAVGTLMIAYILLPRLLLLCGCTADISRRPKSRIALYFFATALLFSAQYFLAPLFLSPLL